MSETLTLQYRTEADVDEALLKKALWGSILCSWRKVFYIVIGVVYMVLLGLFAWIGSMTGNYGDLIKWTLIYLAAAAFVCFTVYMSVQTSLRRWKEQNHVAVLHMFGGFTDEGFVFGYDTVCCTMQICTRSLRWAACGCSAQRQVCWCSMIQHSSLKPTESLSLICLNRTARKSKSSFRRNKIPAQLLLKGTAPVFYIMHIEGINRAKQETGR